MTNGEKIKEIFPNIIKYGNILIDDTGALQKNILFDDIWWNAEYKEPTIQERQAESDKFDAIFQAGYEHGYAQAKYDYEQESTTKNDLVPRNVVERIIKSPRTKEQMLSVLNSLPPQESTPKNNLEVDCISRAEMLKYQQYLHGEMSNEENHKLWEFIKELPSVTPQEPRKGHWIRVTDKTGHLVWECDKCGWQQRFNTNYCPDCGAKNDVLIHGK